MPTLANAPLLEVWVEVRWGRPKNPPPGQLTEFAFDKEDTDFFFGQFRQVANGAGYKLIEEISPNVPNVIPHIVRFRYRKDHGIWPCIQIGLGLFTVNQINEGYEWEKFKLSVIEGLHILDNGHPLGLNKLARFGIELRYRDGFAFVEGQTAPEFLKKNMQIGFDLPQEFLKSNFLGQDFSGMRVAFNLYTSEPKGILITELAQATINGQPGFIMDMIVRSTREDCPEWEVETISTWLQSAHKIHRHAFKTLIDPAFARTFQ